MSTHHVSLTTQGNRTMRRLLFWGFMASVISLTSSRAVSDNCRLEPKQLRGEVAVSQSESAPTPLTEPQFNSATELLAWGCSWDDDGGGASSIIGGKAAEVGKWPWMAIVTHRFKQFCGATVLSKYWILTAKHCHNAMGKDAPLDSARAGMSYLWSIRTQRLFVHKVFPHRGAVMEGHDILLVKLLIPLEFTATVRPACLPIQGVTHTPNCTATGFGLTSHAQNARISRTLQEIDENAMSHERCNLYLPRANKITANSFCGWPPRNNTGVCGGDSGGPLNCPRDTVGGKRRYVVAGIVSYVFESCNKGYLLPNIFTKVEKFVDWIVATIDREDYGGGDSF